MKISNFFLPTLKELPSEAQIASHQLMLKSGMIRQSSAGIYSWLPFGLMVLKKIENIVRDEQNKSGALEILMPTIQPAEIWKESGRYNDYGKELLRIKDRQERDLLYGPTNEELITEIFRSYVKSYKELPKLLYHIQWKFRDEVRPRFGVMRGREFLMKDSYSFDIDKDSSVNTYNKVFYSYLKTFKRMGLKAIPMHAESGQIGGDMSHEFIILAETGETKFYCDKKLLNIGVAEFNHKDKIDYSKEIEKYRNLYAATDDKFKIEDFENAVKKENRIESRGIEVGHIFYFGTKYSKPMGCNIVNNDGSSTPVHMGSYGIGISRLVGAIIEANHDSMGMIWPKEVSPFDLSILNLKVGDHAVDKMSENLYMKLKEKKYNILYDDVNDSPGVKFSRNDLIGLPWQIIIGVKSASKEVYELKNRATNERHELSLDSLMTKLEKEI